MMDLDHLFGAINLPDLLVGIVIFLSILSSLFQKRSTQTRPGRQARPQSPRMPSRSGSAPSREAPGSLPTTSGKPRGGWLRELQRAWEEATEEARKAQQTVEPSPPRQAPAPHVMGPPPTMETRRPGPSMPPPLPVPSVSTSGAPILEEAAVFETDLLSRASSAYQKAHGLDESVSQALRKIALRASTPIRVEVPSMSVCRPSETNMALAAFRNPRAVRQAVIASIILGPPRALEEGNHEGFAGLV